MNFSAARRIQIVAAFGASCCTDARDDGGRCAAMAVADVASTMTRAARRRRHGSAGAARPRSIRTPTARGHDAREIPARHAPRAAGPADAAESWPNGDAAQARRFLRYLDYWRRHSYAMQLLDLEQAYEPFSPDSDLLHTRTFSARGARGPCRSGWSRRCRELLEQANFTRVDPAERPRHPDQGLPLRPRPAGRPRRPSRRC